MSKRDPSIKLASVEANLKRWHTRLTRAANMVAKLEKYRRRLMLEKAVEDRPVALTVKIKMPKTKPVEGVYSLNEAKQGLDEAAAMNVAPLSAEDESLPKWLDRSDPLIAEKMTAARKAAEAAERKKMPLTGKAASDYIKAPRKRKA